MTGRQTGGQADRRTDGQDHVLSQADVLAKNSADIKENALWAFHFVDVLPHLIYQKLS